MELVPKPKHFPTMFGNVLEKSVTFCIDTSGSMCFAMEAVKDHLIEILLQRAYEDTDTTFNIIEFNSEVTQWTDKMVKCSPQTVAIAMQWIQKLAATTGTNTQDALLTAFSDNACEAVYLVTDGLPDQHPNDILDHVAYASHNRPVHCIYIQGENPDRPSIEFLEDLAMETFGSFHIVSVTQHGVIERVTPIYRAEAIEGPAEESVNIITEETVISGPKLSSITTSLTDPPDEIVVMPPAVIAANPMVPYYPYCGWPRYRMARHTSAIIDATDHITCSPAAGELLVGKKVLARKHYDGLFYLGTVKHQISGFPSKFMVEFGPTAHGKFKDPVFQETFVHDIISHADALRHSVTVGDRVLAPFEQNGERYGPGTVINGTEKRIVESPLDDEQLTVAFYNGKSIDVPPGVAVWVPTALHERITFELKLPKNVRREFNSQENYPKESREGYPVASPGPPDYEHFQPLLLHPDPLVWERGVYRYPYYIPTYPIYYKYKPKASTIRSEDIDEVIPGTHLTKSALNEKVMSQLMRHKMVEEDKRDKHMERDTRRLLRRSTTEDNGILKKSVSFGDCSDLEPEVDLEDLEDRNEDYLDADTKDSGHGSTTEFLSDDDCQLADEATQTTRDISVGKNYKLWLRKQKKRSSSPIGKRPAWKYWRNDPAPDIIDPPDHGPYEGTALPAPMETREKYGPAQWNQCMSNYVDTFAKYKYGQRVEDCMFQPRPPSHQPHKQGPGMDISLQLGSPPTDQQRLAQARRDVRKQRHIQRRQNLNQQYWEAENQKYAMEQQRRAKVMDQMAKDNQRHLEAEAKLQQTLDGRRAVSAQVRQRVDEWQQDRRIKEETRLDGRQQRREQMEQQRIQQQREREEAQARQWAAKVQGHQMRHAEQRDRIIREEAELARYADNKRQAKINTINHFHQMEVDAQRKKTMLKEVRDQQYGIVRSQVLP